MQPESVKIAVRRADLFRMIHVLREQMHDAVNALCNHLTGPIQNPVETLADHAIFMHDRAHLAGLRAGDAMRDLESLVADTAPKLKEEMQKVVEDYIDESKENQA